MSLQTIPIQRCSKKKSPFQNSMGKTRPFGQHKTDHFSGSEAQTQELNHPQLSRPGPEVSRPTIARHVGGFEPTDISEKYGSNWEIFPQGVKIKKYVKPPLSLIYIYTFGKCKVQSVYLSPPMVWSPHTIRTSTTSFL